TCGFCSCGCGAYVEVRDGRVAAVCPSTNHPVSTRRLCIKGWNGIPALLGADRLRTPLIRRRDKLEPTSWEDAISFTASALTLISRETGPHSIGVIGSAKTTNEECYSLSRFARTVIGTPNVDGACRFYDAAIIHALLETTGVPACQADLNSVQSAGSMLVVGANVMEQLAHVGTRIEDAALAGCRIVAVDPRTSRIAPHATLFLHPKPAADLTWIRALIKTIVSRKLYVDSVPEMPGFEELRSSVADVAMNRLKGDTGMQSSEIVEMAEMLAKNPPLVVMFGLGVLQQPDATEIVKALADVAILLGGSVMPLRGQNNAQGACDLGLTHDYLPGYGPVMDRAARSTWEEAWGFQLPTANGMSAVDMIRGCSSGKIRGLLVFGENVALSAPNTEESLAALDKVEFLAVSDLYMTETARLADVVFPACSFLEKDGTFTSIDRRVQRVRKVLEPLGESRSDLDIIADLASALGSEIPRSPERVMSEIMMNVPSYKGISYERLDASWGRQWALDGASAKLAAISGGAEKAKDKEYPFHLIAGRINFHQQTGTMAARFGVLAREYPTTYAELNEEDAERLGLERNRPIRISSKTGSLVRTLAVSDSMPPGCVYVPHFFGGDSPNALASYECDPISGVPAYKACAVKVEAAR
ncbi:MAG: molybdopterin-dependent oxidoreductase, partial [Armatimonadetes bacterium]|nr:molybdopterin-dependent oxidoreductase [Armatimonadota bacterium]